MTRLSRPAGLLAASAAAAAVLLTGAAPATAAVGNSTITVEPARVTAHGPVTVVGTVDWGDPRADAPFGLAELRTPGPGPVARAARSDPDTVTWSFSTAPCAPEPLCAGATVLPNGPRALELWDVERVAAEDRQVAQALVLLDVPAGRPQDVQAALSGRTVTVRWARAGTAAVPDGEGTQQIDVVEPDVRWTVSDGRGRTVEATPAACTDGVCTAQLVYPGGESGLRAFTVAASRPCDGCTSAPTASRPSAAVEVPVVPGAAPAGPPGAGTTGGSAAPGAGGGGAGRADLGGFASGFGGFGPRLPTVPALPSDRPPAVAAPEPDVFEETLGYQDRTELERVDPEPQAAAGARLTSTDDGLLADEQVARGLAGALVLALTGAHLRTWLGHARRELDL